MSIRQLKTVKVNAEQITLWELAPDLYQVEAMGELGGITEVYRGGDLLQARVAYANLVLALANAN